MSNDAAVWQRVVQGFTGDMTLTERRAAWAAAVWLARLVRWRRQDLDAWLAGGCRPCRTARGV
jgi:hypothetical protein